MYGKLFGYLSLPKVMSNILLHLTNRDKQVEDCFVIVNYLGYKAEHVSCSAQILSTTSIKSTSKLSATLCWYITENLNKVCLRLSVCKHVKKKRFKGY